MKQFISFLVTIIVGSALFMTSVIDSFAVNEKQWMHENEIIVSSSCCDEWNKEVELSNFIICNDGGICPDGNICECCFSSSENSLHVIRGGSFNTKEKFKKIKVIDFAYLSILRDTLGWNFILNSSSYSERSEPFIIQNSYITLIGSTKSNC